MLESREWDDGSEFMDTLDGWVIAYRVRRNPDGKYGIERLTIRPDYRSWRESVGGPIPQGGVTSGLLRRIQIGAQLRYARDVIRLQRPDPPRPRRTGARGRPRVIPEKRRRKILNQYRALVSARAPHPVKTLAVKYFYNRPAMSKLLKRLAAEYPE
jgi:hypothetical protein